VLHDLVGDGDLAPMASMVTSASLS
jgi:hypothetical protein